MNGLIRVLVAMLGGLCVLLVALTVAASPATGAEPAISANAPSLGLQNAVVIPIWPFPAARIPQNVPTIGCTAHPTAGYGFKIVFRWIAFPAFWHWDRVKELRGYQLFVQHQGEPYPALNVTLTGTRSTSYTWVACQAFVIDSNLDNWNWNVRAVDMDGHVVASSQSSFRFLPCRLDARSGEPCYSSPN